MNREIKFRAWRKSEKKMYGVSTIWLHSRWLGLDGVDGSFAPNLVELTQYTGLTDKNGKEIYEGDIVKYYYGAVSHTAEVFWDIVTSGWQFGIHKTGLSPRNFEVYEVIGNIYENKELLEK